MKHLLSYRNILRLLLASAIFLAALGFTSTASAQSTCGAKYTVQPGDYLMKIARKCGVSLSDLLAANPNISITSIIFPGQVINIALPTIPVTGSKPGTYTVQKGDTLFSIGQTFKVTVAELREANPNLGSTIYVGQVLNIPARIQFDTGGTAAIVQNRLDAGKKHYYLLRASAQQTLDVTLTGPSGFTLAIFGADGTTLKSANSTIGFRGVLPKTQDYILVVASGSSAADYGLSVAIPLRIRFATGGTSATLTGTVPATVSQFFILRASKGQMLNVTATPGDKLQLSIYGVDGTVLKSGMGEGASFSGVLPSTQDYILTLKTANQTQAFTLTVSIPASTTPNPNPGPGTCTRCYTVQRGDTLFSIAQRFSTTVTVLLRANPDITNSNVIEVGQVIYLPGATVTLSNGKVIYIAAPGDTMGSIARTFNVTLSALINANPQISNPNLIFQGQRINIP